MLTGIDPLLTGQLLYFLDRMGHSDSVVIADAHFPAGRLGSGAVLDLPATGSPAMLAAICTVLPLDDAPALDLMASASGEVLAVQQDLMQAAHVDDERVRFIERYDFYDAAAGAAAIVRTGETRSYGNALLRKGVVSAPDADGARAGSAGASTERPQP